MQDRFVRRRAPFAAALISALLGSALLGVYVRRLEREVSGGEPVALLALRQDLVAGSRLRQEHLIPHNVPETYVESRQVRVSEMPKVLGVKTAIALDANQTLSWTDLVSTTRNDHLLSERVPPGMRAIGVPKTSWEADGALLRPGDRVDVFITRTSSEARSVTIPLIQNVLVLSVGNRLTSHDIDSPGRAPALTLLVTIDQASLLVHSRKDSKISLILRNPNDLEVTEGLPDTYDSDILELESRARRQRRVTLERVH